MKRSHYPRYAFGIAVIAAIAMSGERALTQAPDPNSAPNPYQLDANWAKPPDGPPNCPAANASASHSPVPSSDAHAYCCSTSRSVRSTR